MIVDAHKLARIRSDLQDPDLLRACEVIVDALQRTAGPNLAHITYGQFRDIGAPSEVIAKSLHYLAGDVGILQMHFEFITEDQDTHEISIDEIQESEKLQRYYDPRGESIEKIDFYRHIFPYFTPANIASGHSE